MKSSVDIYKHIARVPEIVNAEFISNVKHNNEEYVIEICWQNRDLLKMRKVKSYENIFVSSNQIISSIANSQSHDLILRRRSPSGKKLATVYQNSNEMYIKIAESDGQQLIINLKEMDAHGMIYSDPYTSSLEWSTDEKYVLYIAEERRPEAFGYYDSKLKMKENDSDVGSKFLHRDDWGEQMIGQHQSVVVKLDIYNNNVTSTSVGNDLTPGESIFVPFTHEIIGVATVCQPVRLGRAYSSDREAVLFHVNEHGSFSELTPRGLHSEKPRFSPDGTKLIYLQSYMFGPVVGTAQIWMMEWSSKKKNLLLDYVEDRMEVIGSDEFRGVCTKVIWPTNCWNSTSKKIYFSALNRNNYMLCELDTETYQIRVYPSKSSHIILDVKYDMMLVRSSSATEPDCLLLGQIFSEVKEFEPNFRKLTFVKPLQELPKDWYDIWEFPVKDSSSNDVLISAMYIGPTSKDQDEHKRPLIVWPHGGPHAIRINAFNHWYAFMVAMGYSIVLPNYRGSPGMGQKIMTASIGRCGLDDVEDCKVTMELCLKRFSNILDETRIYGIGLSHGGFITAHLIAKYPDMMKAVCLINSAVDIHFMATASDIPEWAFLEYGMSYKIGREMDKEAVLRFYERSPISYVNNIKTPMMFLMGSEDIRSPRYQCLNFHRLLMARNIPTKAFLYRDDHPLSSLEAESDAVIQISKWFQEHDK